MNDYKNLDVFIKCRALIKDVYLITALYPKEENYGLTLQIRRAAVSILSNLSEGMGRQHINDMINFLHIARGSLYELEAQLLISQDLKYIDDLQFSSVNTQLQDCRKILNGFINYQKKKRDV